MTGYGSCDMVWLILLLGCIGVVVACERVS